MRILIATDHFPPFIGGAHRWASLLADGLARRGHGVSVATVWSGGLPRQERHGEEAVPVYRLRQLRTASPALVRDTNQRHAPPFPDPLMVRGLRRMIDAARPEVVLTHGWISASVLEALRGSEIPVVLSAHDYGYFCPTRILLYEGKPCTGPGVTKCLRCAGDLYGATKGAAAVASVERFKRTAPGRIGGIQSVTSFVDETNAQHLLGRTGAAQNIRRYVVPAFVDVDRPGDADPHEVERMLAQLPREPFILFVGAIRPVKGVNVLFDAYDRLRNPPPLVLMGTIERDTPTPLPSHATVLTTVPHVAVMEGWRRAMLGVVPSVWPEPLGTVSAEGISHGVPMIATVPSGMVDVVGDGVGILVPQGDVAALAEAMQSVIDDPGRREAMARAGRTRSREFQAEAVLTRYEVVLREMVAAG
jgi:glycosyltransferase involved in cell wall biosynthesis